MFMVSLDPFGSDFVLRAGFAPFLYRLIEHATRRIEERRVWHVGETYRGHSGGPIRMKTPAGNWIESADGRVVLDEPGFYRRQVGTAERGLAVQLDSEESNLRPMTEARITALAQKGQVTAWGGSIGPRFSTAPPPAPDARWRLWWWLLAAALALLAVETLVAVRTIR
jgi:hypothetical protein